MGVRQRMADAVGAVAGISRAGFQKLDVNWRHVQHSGFLVLEHIRAEFYTGVLVIDKIFIEAGIRC